MKYISTRGHGPVTFNTALLDGLAPDGGLYVPDSYPQMGPSFLRHLGEMSWQQIAEEIMLPFVTPDMPQEELRRIIDKATAAFSQQHVTPLRHLGDDIWLLELFHGPTLAFKDVALQMLGHMLDHALSKEKRNLTVLGATSGDTGSAAIAGMQGRDHITSYILFPKGRVSPIQQKQMTTTGAANVHPIAIEGTFDDCQQMVKAAFGDKDFREALNLTAVNSISWARLLPQIVYYFYAWSRLPEEVAGENISFAVPTGNFGDVFAGYVARRMGLPIDKLVIATNVNDILVRFLHEGDYSKQEVTPTDSPSMDIMVASNFERLLFDMIDRDSTKLTNMMHTFADKGKLPPLTEAQMARMRDIFEATSVSDKEAGETIRLWHESEGIMLDPHTAVGVYAAERLEDLRPIVALATAHPAKFPQAVERAVGMSVKIPERLQKVMEQEERFETLPANVEALKKRMRDTRS